MKKTCVFVAVAMAGLFTTACDNIPAWRIMQATAKGQATLAESNNARQVLVSQAKAQEEAAQYTAEAEITKAHGVATANQIMASSLGGPEGYLRWKYIEMLQDQKGSSTIYIPTEAGLPILEAGHRNDK